MAPSCYNLRPVIARSNIARDAAPSLPPCVHRGTQNKAVKIKLIGLWAQHRPPTSHLGSLVNSPIRRSCGCQPLRRKLVHRGSEPQSSLKPSLKRKSTPESFNIAPRYSLRKVIKTSSKAREACPELPPCVHRGTRSKAVQIKLVSRNHCRRSAS